MSHGPTTGSLVWRLSTRWRAAVDRALAPLGLTQAQFAFLGPLFTLSSAGRRPSQRALADFTGLDPIYVSKLAKTLEKAGLIERPADPDDPRAVRLALTDTGRDVLFQAFDLVRAVNDAMTAPIGGQHGQRDNQFRDTLLALLGESAPTSNPASTTESTTASTPSSAAEPSQPWNESNESDETNAESETTMTAPAHPRAVSGRELNLAAAATRGLLDSVLDQAGLTFTEHVTLRAVAAGAATPDEVATALGAGRPGVPTAADLRTALGELATAGLLAPDTDPARLRVTGRGQDLLARITAATDEIGDRLFGDIPADELATTRRVLDLVLSRAAEVRPRL